MESNRQILFTTQTRNSVEWLQNLPSAGHRYSELPNIYTYIFQYCDSVRHKVCYNILPCGKGCGTLPCRLQLSRDVLHVYPACFCD